MHTEFVEWGKSRSWGNCPRHWWGRGNKTNEGKDNFWLHHQLFIFSSLQIQP